MKISLNWLNDYIDLKNISVSEIVDKLTYAGLEVEEVFDQAKQFEKIVVGFVKEAKKHPNADKLSVCTVSDGTQDYNVVCGAPNVATGQKVAFAKVGAVIPNGGMKLEKAKIRGEVSFGMICSERELGISDNHEGIIVLNPGLKEGTPISDALEMNDVILEVAITPNRADALSHIGVARDLSALFDRDIKLPKVEFNESKKKSEELATVEIIDAINCPRYVGKVVSNVEIKESPDWLKKRLKSIGLRPINNVVDVTNFVLYEVGQPLHAFDLDNLNGKKIVVRQAGSDKKFTTLDSKERELDQKDLMICDGAKPVAVAGVMGGENSEVTSSTKNILIESAFFNPSSIRKTAKHLGLSTDASYRFERGTDPGITKWAARRASQLIQKIAGGEIASGEIDAYPKQIADRTTSVRFTRIDHILGYHIDSNEVEKILHRLGFGIKSKSSEELSVIIPSYRHDIEREIDLIEEVARVYGYNKIPEINKMGVTLEQKVDHSAFDGNVRDLLNSLGFYEIITNSFLSESIAEKFGKPINVLNPQSSELSHLRPSLLPGMLTTISNNLKVNEHDLKLFEIGKVFEKITEKNISSFNDFRESERLLVCLTGNDLRTDWFAQDRAFDAYDLKGFVESFLNKLICNSTLNVSYPTTDDSHLEMVFNLSIGNQILGFGGKVKKEACMLFDVDQEVFVFEADLVTLKQIAIPERTFHELLKYPKVYRDFAFVLDVPIDSLSIIEVIKSVSSNLLHNIKLFDIFQSESLGKGKKSLAFQLEYYHENRTLTEEEVDKEFRNAIKAVEQKLNGKLRGS
ncbi:MAG: phenylalanine--tRNA ligase subunit beta [Bacteroidetes bacterium]|nr:phenylalanine--tRNA ligase subunit beta [Bacteroidota bacterium]